ncbi:adaptin N terminal region-domain-containing protein [Gautieria morchelliformis]|nr:adaptin N terminal region-domain-containing protein [Gautieria morchelliformis]
MWERTLQDLIRGLRANKKDEPKFIAQAIDEIRREVRSKDMDLKAAAVLKLTYLDMMGYNMAWASFHVVEVMSSAKFHLKSVGYLAAVQSFSTDTDVLMLTTNLLKKDLSSNPSDVAVSLNGLAHIASPDLARDLSYDLVSMLNHSRSHIRKRAVLALYNVFVRYPDALQHSFPRLREKLEDSDPGVVAATVNVLCELALRNPTDYLPLAPQLFHILTTSANNWMLIKIIKLFGALTPHEPRLVKKLQPPMTRLISTTPAISLLYECVRTCIIGDMLQGPQGDSLARTCVTKLAAFLEDSDQNLKYIALLALVKIVPSHPHLVAEYQATILSSVDDPDISIRMRALELVSEMVTPANLQSIVQQLLFHLINPTTSQPSASHSLSLLSSSVSPSSSSASPSSPLTSPAYRHLLTHRILSLTSRDGYANIVDFEWYFAVLIDLAYVSPVPGSALRDALLDVVVRVRAVRGFAVKLCTRLLGDDAFVTNATSRDSLLNEAGDVAGSAEVLWAAAWICGEYCRELLDPLKFLSYLLQPSSAALPPEIISVYIQAAFKVFGHWSAELAGRWNEDHLAEVKQAVDMVVGSLQSFVGNENIEVQERAANTLQLFAFLRADLATFKPPPPTQPPPPPEFDAGFANGFSDPPAAAEAESSSASLSLEPRFPKSLFLIRPLCAAYELNPVAREAQASVPVPDGLDLDAWIVPPPREDALETATTGGATNGAAVKKKKGKGKGKERAEKGAGKVKGGRGEREKENAGAGALVDVQPEETPDEKAARERRRAERLERLKDDPYYLIDDRPQSAPPQQATMRDEDVESIPVVKLDGLDAPFLPRPLRTHSSASLPRMPQQRAVVDTGGEMPDGAQKAPQPHALPPPLSLSSTPDRAQLRNARSTPLRPFHQYDDEEGVSTPEPIRVVRAKKKGTGTGKKRKPKELLVDDLVP